MVPEPAETFSLVAELAVAFVGFSGIVVALGRRQMGDLNPLERRRLANLFWQAFAALITSLFVLTLLHAKVPVVVIWRLASAAWAAAAVLLAALDWRRVRALSEPERALLGRPLVAAVYGAVILIALLQVSNSVYLHTVWPILVAVSVNLLIAFLLFVLLLFTGLRDA
jgi:hypothetical protein